MPTLKNHTATLVDNRVRQLDTHVLEGGGRGEREPPANHFHTHTHPYIKFCIVQIFVFGGYDGQKNHSTLHVFDHTTGRWICQNVAGKAPPGRNGHTATLAEGKLFIIGGWLGSGPLAASDVHYIDIANMQWVEPPVLGEPPGPCNMHTSDFFPHRRQIIVFRGGDGKEYLNDLHGLNVDTLQWERLECTGVKPEARANHCSAVMDHQLFIFGGWNGQTRLNDVHVLDTNTLVWRRLEPRGVPPPPRAGMTLTRIRDRLYLFGGSGPAAKCFDDLQILDLKEMCW
jgi:N-acetylneuraminic acid mutarotase